MIIELYASGSEHPGFYDAYVDKEGTLWGMAPQVRPMEDIIQIVLENDGECPNRHQRGAVKFLLKMNNAEKAYFYKDRKAGPYALYAYSVTEI